MAVFKRRPKAKFEGGGLVLFQDVQQAMCTEKVLKSAGYAAKLVAPPPDLRKGCDLALEINLVEQPGIERLLRASGAAYIGVDPVRVGTAPLLDVVKVADFREWVMVKAGNMKITCEKSSGVIVNVSGGGCPDIPYLYAELIGRRFDEVARPRDIGFTLCALNLDRALDECFALQLGRRES